MNNLHRELAPISDAAWAQIEEEASRTVKRHLAARRVVDVEGPKGVDLSAVGTGHQRQIQTPGDGIEAAQREAKALVELRVPFELAREAIDDVERGANDSDWSPLKEAARKIAFAEDRAVFDGYAAAGIQGIRQGSSNPVLTLPFQRQGLSGCGRAGGESIAPGRCQWTLRALAGHGAVHRDRRSDATTGIRSCNISSVSWTERSFGRRPSREASCSRPVAAIFELTIGQDISIGYLSHSETTVRLYFQETFTFRLLTTEAAVVLAPGTKKSD